MRSFINQRRRRWYLCHVSVANEYLEPDFKRRGVGRLRVKLKFYL